MATEIYTINKETFPFETKGIIGVITEDEKFCWAMDLYAGPGEIEGQNVNPKFSFTELEPATDFIYNQSFIWPKTSAYNTEKEDWVGSFYIFDAHYFDSVVELKKVDSNSFHAKITGQVNLNWETAPTTNFNPFHLESIVPFNGILSEIGEEKKAFEIAGKYLEVKDMKWMEGEDSFWIVNK